MSQRAATAAMGGLLSSLVLAGAISVEAQTGYQYEELAPDPVLKTPATLESMLMRAGYEQRHRDCLDAGFHLDAVVATKPDWAGALELRLFCEREENRRVDELADLTKLIDLQPTYWKRWFDRAGLHQRNLERKMALEDLTEAIKLRWWDPALYAQRASWEEALEEYPEAFADVEEVHRLYPEAAGPLKEMARLAVKAGWSAADAARYLKTAEFGDPKPEDSPRKDDDLLTDGMGSEELMLRAGYAARLNKLGLELRLLNAALIREPGLMPALEKRIQITKWMTPEQWSNLRGFQMPDPRKDVETLISIEPKRADYYRLRIELRPPYHSESDQEKLRDYGTIILLEPYVASNHADRAGFQMQMMTSNLDAAIEDYRRAIEMDPGNAQYCYQMAHAYAKKKALLTEALALNWALIGEPDNAMWLRERAKLP